MTGKIEKVKFEKIIMIVNCQNCSQEKKARIIGDDEFLLLLLLLPLNEILLATVSALNNYGKVFFSKPLKNA